MAPQINLTFSWPTNQMLSCPVIDTIGATVKQDRRHDVKILTSHLFKLFFTRSDGEMISHCDPAGLIINELLQR